MNSNAVPWKSIGAGGGDDADLRAVALAVGGAVGVGDHVEFAHCVDAEQLAAGAAGRDVDERGAGVFDAVEEEEIVLRTAAADGEHVADGGVRGADAAGALAGVVDGGGVEGEQFVVAAAVEGKLLDLALVDEAGGLLRGGVHAGIGGVDFDGLLDGGNTEDEVELKALADGEGDAGLLLRRETVVLYRNGVGADWDGGRKEAAF